MKFALNSLTTNKVKALELGFDNVEDYLKVIEESKIPALGIEQNMIIQKDVKVEE